MTYALAFFVLFLSGHPLTTVPNNLWLIAYVIAFGLAASLVSIRRNVETQFFLNRLGLLCLLLVFTLLYEDVNFVAIKFILFFTLGLVITMIGSEKDVLLPLALVNFYLLFLSLVCYLVINLAGIGVQGFSFSNVNDVPYRSILFYNWFDNFLAFRNTGFYWEPGILATNAILTAAILAKFNQLFNHRKILISLVVISTFSVFGIMLSLFLLSKKRDENIVFIATVIGFLCVLVYIFPGSIVEYFHNITQKFFIASKSVDERVTSYQETTKLFLDNIQGMGIGTFYNELEKLGSPFTSSVMGLGVSYPVFFMILGVSFLYRIFKQGLSELKIIVVILLAASKEPVLFSMSIILICLGFSCARYTKNY